MIKRLRVLQELETMGNKKGGTYIIEVLVVWAAPKMQTKNLEDSN